MSLMKPILGSMVVAAAVTIACLFLPFIGVIASEHPLVFFGAVLTILVPINIVRLNSASRVERQKECDKWHQENRDAMDCPTYCYDPRNVDRQLHIYDGFRD